MLLHTFLEGLAIGVFDEVSEMALLASSVIIHKVPVAYSIGLIFYNQNQPLMKISTLGFFISFVLSTPVGLIIGAAINVDGGLTVIII